jgi:uncharacterized protein (TIGR00255 family)
MTGFGGAVQSDDGITVRVEVRSVNHRHLQVKTRLPQEHQNLEGEVETQVKAHAERGAITVSVLLERSDGDAPARIDARVAKRYADEINRLRAELSLASEVSIDALLALPGVVASTEDDRLLERESKLIARCLGAALKELVVMREREGTAMQADLRKHAKGIQKVVARIEKRMPKALEEHHANLLKRLGELLAQSGASKKSLPVAQADLAREIALLADRMDTSEELARLESHLSQLEKLLDTGKAVGRQLDFLVQEFLREANTIGSKCADAEAAHAVVELKTLIERLREQVQNVE